MTDSGIKLRRARRDDCDLYFEWVNDPAVRGSAFNSAPVKYDDHCAWFVRKLDSQTSFLYIAEADGRPVGQIRIDCEAVSGEIDISIDTKQRGKGYASAVLRAACEMIKDDHPQCRRLVGKVKHQNAASQKAFLAAGFQEEGREAGYIAFVRNIAGGC